MQQQQQGSSSSDGSGNSSSSRFAERLPLLLLISLAACCPGFFHQSLAILQPSISKTSQPNCSSSSSSSSIIDCCSDCLGIGDASYNWMLSSMWWCSLIAVPFAGWLLDKVGNSVCVLISFLLTVGATLIAVASCLRGSVLMLPLLNVGTAVCSFGMLPANAARERILGVWFRDSHLSFAFGIASSFNRAVALPAFFLLEPLREMIGLQATLFCCAAVCVIGLICAIAVAALDASYCRKLGFQQQQQQKQQRESVSVFDLQHASCEFWPLSLAFTLFAVAFYTYHDNSVEFLHEKFAFSKKSAAQCSSLLHLIGIVGSPLAGLLIDKLGHPIIFLFCTSSLMIPALALLAFTSLTPIISSSMIGIAMSVVNPAALASLAQSVSQSILGMAMSVPLLLMPLFSAVLHLIIGAILGNESRIPIAEKILRWQKSMILIISVDALSVLAAFSLIAIACWRTGLLFPALGSTFDQKSSTMDYEVISDDDNQGSCDRKSFVSGNNDCSSRSKATKEEQQRIY